MRRLFIAETEFDRSMSWLGKGAEAARTIIFPNTVRKVSETAFNGNQLLRSTVLNEGPEELMGDYDGGTFADSGLRQIALPATLEVLGNGIFLRCRDLKRVTFAENSHLREIGVRCFCGSGIEEFCSPP